MPEVPLPAVPVLDDPEPELVEDDSEAPEPDELAGEVWLVVTPEPLAAAEPLSMLLEVLPEPDEPLMSLPLVPVELQAARPRASSEATRVDW